MGVGLRNGLTWQKGMFFSMSNQISIGWGSCSITPDRPMYVLGQLYERISSYVHDPVTVTALALSNGEEQCVFLSADMGIIFEEIMERVQDAVDGRDGLDASKIVFSATHTHNSAFYPYKDQLMKRVIDVAGTEIIPPQNAPVNILGDDEAIDFIVEKFSEVILDAWTSRKPGSLSWASDYAVVGFNRRPRFGKPGGEAESLMYGDCSRSDFIGLEGTSDHTADMIYTFDDKGSLSGVLVAIPSPSQVMELHRFITADFWCYARDAIRSKFGSINVLAISAASGDQNPVDLVRISKNNSDELAAWNAQAGEVFRNFDMTEECQGIGDRIAEAVGRGYKKSLRHRTARPVFKHVVKMIGLPIRTIEESDYLEAENVINSIVAEFSPSNRMTGTDLVRLFEPLGVTDRWEMQNKTTTFSFQSNIIRIGDAAINTNPFELFVEYAMRMRARARAGQVMSFQITNGSGIYLPTRIAVESGSYSSKPVSNIVGPEGGDMLVEILITEMDNLWD